ncbi:MAG: hypothetical protein JNL80_12160 [Phycisphaerae bacterium]|jgi:type IV pilus assembly protein PilQ|nr:hypothetical protein [Phycisphaerae bacterium]
MSDDRRTYRNALPLLFPGVMFILPLALVQPALGQAGGGSTSTPPATSGDEKKSIQAAGKETFTIQFQDTDILQALQLLSIQGQKNIIAGKGVSGTVTANLFEVTVQEALEVILKANDLRFEEVGNFIYVYTLADWEAMQQARRKKESRRFTLEYIGAKDANEFVQPLISEVGKVSFIGQTEKGVQADVSNAGEDSWAFQAMLVVNDYPENLQAISDFLAEIDTPPTQVSVESTIVSTRVNEDNAFGVDFSVIGDLDFSDLANPLAAVNNLIGGNNSPGTKATDDLGFQPADNRAAAGSTTVGRTSQAGGLKVGVLSENVAVFLRVLDEVTDTMVLARPRVMALNRQRSHILVGEKVGYISTTQTETTATQTVNYLDTGIKLIFRPFISKDGSIRMELAPSVSEATLRQVTTDAGGGMVIPDEKTNEVTTNVRVKDGQTLVLGGLFQEKTTISRRQVPLLGDVPILGNAFKGQDDKLERNEIIFLITPTIMHDSLIDKQGHEANEFAEAVRVGARESLLPFSREAMSSSHNQQAFEALAKGDTAKALYHTENSLRINKNQPEMMRLREQLDKTKPNRVFERDMYRRIQGKRNDLMEAQQAELAAAAAAQQPPMSDPLMQPMAQNDAASNATASVEESTVYESEMTPTPSEVPTDPQFEDGVNAETQEGYEPTPVSGDESTFNEGTSDEATPDQTAQAPTTEDEVYYPSTSEVIASILNTPAEPMPSDIGDPSLDPECEGYEALPAIDEAQFAAVTQQPILSLPLATPETSVSPIVQEWSLLAMIEKQYGFSRFGMPQLSVVGLRAFVNLPTNNAVTRSAVTIEPNPAEIAEVGESSEVDPMNLEFPAGNEK